MNQELKLKLQAHLDNEVSERDSREVLAQLERDPEARALRAELQSLKTALRLGEPEVKLPESREFYWSKIERAILRETEAVPASSTVPRQAWWTRLLAPALGSALLLAVVLSLVHVGTNPSPVSYLHEIETPLEDTSTISFHSQAAGMTVVWVQSRID